MVEKIFPSSWLALLCQVLPWQVYASSRSTLISHHPIYPIPPSPTTSQHCDSNSSVAASWSVISLQGNTQRHHSKHMIIEIHRAPKLAFSSVKFLKINQNFINHQRLGTHPHQIHPDGHLLWMRPS